ncbi:hypothetical protein [Bacillus sp. UMB0728]|uniref:hypothetical protein n=1 Tax=Bacillus sp. UMB0728 TaxID=2066052 RepID=UPI000C75FA9C|nr:hypothetical protein [Bacillus sp. UMB0728]PLR71041.1 hypothetical protein CYJ37_19845 [Bacillus sp. UMB0728]
MKYYLNYTIYFLGTNLVLIAVLRSMLDISNRGVVLILLFTTFIHLYDLGWLKVNIETDSVPLRTEIIILFVCLFSIYLFTLSNLKPLILLLSIMIVLPIAIYDYLNNTMIKTNNKLLNYIRFIVSNGFGIAAVMLFVVFIIIKILVLDNLKGEELNTYLAYVGDSATILSLALIVSSYGFRKTKGYMSDNNLAILEERCHLRKGCFKQILQELKKIKDTEEKIEALENVEKIIIAVSQKKIEKALRIFDWLPQEIRSKHIYLKEELKNTID